ncbi:hypothetical protein HME9304_02117 [Flagellimonas maritima]|uniref:Uncharacterized protein n=1 Tax=Flagellimonas maritima TaxID=1383885 RepID=A0A2Z4LUY3_9FLAO|nr:hypothetical protein HME9304_02117 [Allomuricauda aurantiaca]
MIEHLMGILNEMVSSRLRFQLYLLEDERKFESYAR